MREVVETMQRVSGQAFPEKTGPRRPGDPARLVAAAARARDLLGWQPRRVALATQISDAWRWHQKQLGGRSRAAR